MKNFFSCSIRGFQHIWQQITGTPSGRWASTRGYRVGCTDCRGSPEQFRSCAEAVKDAEARLLAQTACSHELRNGAVDWPSFYVLPNVSNNITKINSATVGPAEMVSWHRETIRSWSPATGMLQSLWVLSFFLHLLVIVGWLPATFELVSLIPLLSFSFLALSMNRGLTIVCWPLSSLSSTSCSMPLCFGSQWATSVAGTLV